MLLRWKLFYLANIILLVLFVFLSLELFGFVTITSIKGNEIFEVTLLCVGHAAVIVNCFFNFSVYHKNLPGTPLSQRKKVFYYISLLLTAISLLASIIYLFPIIQEEIKENPDQRPKGILITGGFVVLVLFILINQLLVEAFIKEYKKKTDENRLDC